MGWQNDKRRWKDMDGMIGLCEKTDRMTEWCEETDEMMKHNGTIWEDWCMTERERWLTEW